MTGRAARLPPESRFTIERQRGVRLNLKPADKETTDENACASMNSLVSEELHFSQSMADYGA
jgi:hypothetical protein